MSNKNSSLLAAMVCMSTLASSVALAGARLDIGDDAFITVGAGMRSSVSFVSDGAPSGDTTSKDFAQNSMRLYMGGQLLPGVGFTFNTEMLDGQMVEVIDSIVRFEPSPAFNVWMGRMLTPADRIEMNGPYYALSWNQYTVPLFPSDQGGEAGRLGRDEGITVWGSVGRFQYAIGAFDGLQGGANQDDSLLFATRLAYNFWNLEGNPAYYTSSTYYGAAGDVFTLGFSAQRQQDGAGTAAEPASFKGMAIDLLMEKVLPGDNVLTIEGEFKKFDTDLTAAALADADCFCLFDGKSWFATAGYLIGSPVGMGKLQPYVRVTKNSPTDAESSDLKELGVNYVIKGHNLRFNGNYTRGDANLTGSKAAEEIKTLSLGVQFQI